MGRQRTPARGGQRSDRAAARTVSLIDVYDALTHERPHKHKHAWPYAMTEIERQRGAQVEPSVFVRMLEHEGLREQLG